jgi:transcription antitermination factor NusG
VNANSYSHSTAASDLSLAKWYAVYTTPRHEKRIAEHFDMRQIEYYLPLYHALHRWKNGSRVNLELPLFPNYVFVRIGRNERVGVLSVPGVLWIVGGREPAELPNAEIESLRAGLQARKAEPHPYLVVGERVRIRIGALAGMEGVLVRIKNDFRVVLTLDLIRRSVVVEVDAGDVEAVTPRPHFSAASSGAAGVA